ncbi:septal ring lytic transglycosylase RlpA family protein [Lichenicoccus sp.]|uniref:septal ring lytic transglycosylase RlpA family protein n=1 Tax=Lichenicoccus sp. TaxID=2781899 RepID=UPI003D0D7C88
MPHVPLGTVVEVTSLHLDDSTISVEVTDRGPYVIGRIIDLTPTTFQAFTGSLDVGVVQVKVQVP